MGDQGLNEEKNDELLTETYTEFPQYAIGTGGIGQGKLASFFSKFFARRGRRPKKVGRLPGDTLTTTDVFTNVPGIGISRGIPHLPQVEHERKRRYREYENMDDYPEIGAALDIYGDDSTQKNISGEVFEITSNHELVTEATEDFLKILEGFNIIDSAKEVIDQARESAIDTGEFVAETLVTVLPSPNTTCDQLSNALWNAHLKATNRAEESPGVAGPKGSGNVSGLEQGFWTVQFGLILKEIKVKGCDRPKHPYFVTEQMWAEI